MTTAHRLQPPRWTDAAAQRWCSMDVSIAARDVASDVIGVGEILPLARFAGAKVFPVVEWHWEALWTRLGEMMAPLLNPGIVRDLLEEPSWRHECPTVLSIVGFIGVAPLASARRELAGLRSMGRTVAMTPEGEGMSVLTLMEFDLQGTAVVSMDEELRVLVDGDGGARHGSAMSPVWKRFYEEQLFDWAMKTESLPSLTR